MIAERPLRHARRLNNVTHTGADIAPREHDLESVNQYPVFIGNSIHDGILRPYIVFVNATQLPVVSWCLLVDVEEAEQ